MQCFLNGSFLPLAQARISPLDRGFLFGDGVYEVVPVYRRRLFHWRRHLERLTASLEKIQLAFDTDILRAAAQRLIDDLPESEQALYLQITRGEMLSRRLTPPPDATPTVFMAAWPRAAVDAGKLASGVHCRSVQDIRWGRCDIKSTSLLAAALLSSAAADGEEEVIIMRDGVLSEGSSSNFIVVKNGALHTPLADTRMLAGITYRVACEVAQSCGLAVCEADVSSDQLANADEIWLTSSLRELLPVTRVDGRAVGSGQPGEVFRRVHAAWRRYVDSDCWHAQ